VDGVIGFNDGDCDVDRWIDDELQLGLAAIVDRQTFQQEGTETGTGTTTEGVIHEEALETRTVISQLTYAVENEVNHFLSDGVVTTRIVVGSIFLSRDKLLWVVDLAVGSSTDFVDHSWFQIDEDSTWDVLASSGLGEESVEGIFTNTDRLV